MCVVVLQGVDGGRLRLTAISLEFVFPESFNGRGLRANLDSVVAPEDYTAA